METTEIGKSYKMIEQDNEIQSLRSELYGALELEQLHFEQLQAISRITGKLAGESCLESVQRMARDLHDERSRSRDYAHAAGANGKNAAYFKHQLKELRNKVKVVVKWYFDGDPPSVPTRVGQALDGMQAHIESFRLED